MQAKSEAKRSDARPSSVARAAIASPRRRRLAAFIGLIALATASQALCEVAAQRLGRYAHLSRVREDWHNSNTEAHQARFAGTAVILPSQIPRCREQQARVTARGDADRGEMPVASPSQADPRRMATAHAAVARLQTRIAAPKTLLFVEQWTYRIARMELAARERSSSNREQASRRDASLDEIQIGKGVKRCP